MAHAKIATSATRCPRNCVRRQSNSAVTARTGTAPVAQFSTPRIGWGEANLTQENRPSVPEGTRAAQEIAERSSRPHRCQYRDRNHKDRRVAKPGTAQPSLAFDTLSRFAAIRLRTFRRLTLGALVLVALPRRLDSR